MQKANSGNGSNGIAVAVTRLGNEPIPVTLSAGATVKDALDKAGITAASNAQYFVDGQRAELNDVLEDGDVLAVVTPKQAGSK